MDLMVVQELILMVEQVQLTLEEEVEVVVLGVIH